MASKSIALLLALFWLVPHAYAKSAYTEADLYAQERPEELQVRQLRDQEIKAASGKGPKDLRELLGSGVFVSGR